MLDRPLVDDSGCRGRDRRCIQIWPESIGDSDYGDPLPAVPVGDESRPRFLQRPGQTTLLVRKTPLLILQPLDSRYGSWSDCHSCALGIVHCQISNGDK